MRTPAAPHSLLVTRPTECPAICRPKAGASAACVLTSPSRAAPPTHKQFRRHGMPPCTRESTDSQVTGQASTRPQHRGHPPFPPAPAPAPAARQPLDKRLPPCALCRLQAWPSAAPCPAPATAARRSADMGCGMEWERMTSGVTSPRPGGVDPVWGQGRVISACRLSYAPP